MRGAVGAWGRGQEKIEMQRVFSFINSYGKVKNGAERRTMLGSSHCPTLRPPPRPGSPAGPHWCGISPGARQAHTSSLRTVDHVTFFLEHH